MGRPVDGERRQEPLPQVLNDLGIGFVVGRPERAVIVNAAFCGLTGYAAEAVLALRPFAQIFAPEARGVIADWAARHLPGDDRATDCYETDILHRDGRRIPVVLNVRVGWWSERKAVLMTFRDLTQHRSAAAELAARARQQEVVAELGRQALVDRNLPSLMDAAVLAVAGTLGVDHVEVWELLSHRHTLLLRAGMGWDDGLVGELTIPAGRGSPAGLTLDSDGPVVVAEFARETRVAVPVLLSERGLVAGAFVVIRGVEQPYGVLAAETTSPRAFDRDDVHFLRALANVLADAIGRDRAEGALRVAHARERHLRQRLEVYSRRVVDAQEVERRRIAHELHDEIGQSLTGLKLTLEDHDRLSAEAAVASVAHARELTAELLRRVQDISLDLRPAMLDELGLRPALLWLVERYTAQTGIEVSVACSGLGTRLHPQIETAAYRIVQEALTNVARHAGVKRAAVYCALTGAELRIEVADHGVGFDLEAIPVGASSGLVGMEERARSSGGRLSLSSAAGRGTSVVARLPVVGSEASP